jgi:RecA/RadA recombinase
MSTKEKDKDKLKALEMAITQIEKNFGKGSIMRWRRKHCRGIQAHLHRLAHP